MYVCICMCMGGISANHLLNQGRGGIGIQGQKVTTRSPGCHRSFLIFLAQKIYAYRQDFSSARVVSGFIMPLA